METAKKLIDKKFLYILVVILVLLVVLFGYYNFSTQARIIMSDGGGRVKLPPFDFSLSVSPNFGTIIQGQYVESAITVALLKGKTQNVQLTATDCPPYVTCSFNPGINYPTYTSLLTISTSDITPVGSYPIIIVGSGGGKTRTTTYILTVDPMPTCSDGTPYGKCSATKPKYCSDGTLINRCTFCGCPSGQSCNITTDSCYTPCSNHAQCSQACTNLCPTYVYGCCYGCNLGQCVSGKCQCVDATSYCSQSPPYQKGSTCTAPCTCGTWINGLCGAGGCNSTLRLQTRTCTPSGCGITSQCVADSACLPHPDSCSDTDGGWNFITKGTISGYINNVPYSRTDYCGSSTGIQEFYCSGTKNASVYYDCRYEWCPVTMTNCTVCSNGACV